MIYLGIDPGASGGMVALGDGEPKFRSMPDTELGCWDWINFHIRIRDLPAVAVIEKVSGYIGQGQPGSSMFNFGMSYGALRMALVASGLEEDVTFHAVTPQAWQKALGIPHKTRAESKTDWKNRLKATAERIFPDLKITLATADALLIAHYCRETYGKPV